MTKPSTKSIHLSITEGWLTLTVTGKGSASFPLAGSDRERDGNIDDFAEALKRALRGEEI